MLFLGSIRMSCAAALLSLGLFQHCAAEAVSVVTTIVVQAPRPTHEPSFVDDGDFIASVLNSTNKYRYEHGVLPLAWNDSLATYAQNWTEACDFVHSHGPSGENLAEGYNNATASIEAWGNERDLYNFDKQGFAEATGHFTQLVWNTTSTVGCGRKFCNTGIGGWYLVCEYWPAGNVLGSFDQHVFKKTNDGAGYVFQNCTQTNNCTAVPTGYVTASTGGGGSGSGSSGGGSGSKSDASRTIIGPLMAGIVLLATMLSLWEPWQASGEAL